MLIDVLILPRKNSPTQVTKMLLLKCDSCNKEFNRRWQREVFEQRTHCCSRKCSYLFRSSNENWKKNISKSVKEVMSKPEIRKNFEEGIKRRETKRIRKPKIMKLSKSEARKKFWSNSLNRKSMSEKIKASWVNSQSGHGTSQWIAKQSAAQRLLWNDDTYRKSRSGSNNPMSGIVHPWWKSWMTSNQRHIKWANAIKKLCGNRCMLCHDYKNLDAHHIAPKSTHPNLAFDLNNGIALCHNCHKGNNASVHSLLRTNAKQYQMLMQELLHKRSSLLYTKMQQETSETNYSN